MALKMLLMFLTRRLNISNLGVIVNIENYKNGIKVEDWGHVKSAENTYDSCNCVRTNKEFFTLLEEDWGEGLRKNQASVGSQGQ